MIDKSKLHPTVQKLVQVWPLVAFAIVAATAGAGSVLKAYAQIGETASDLADTRARVSKLEQRIPDIREDLATIKQQGADNGARLDRIEQRLNTEDGRRSQ
jgi:outer membrane murein-binding lipoprotein Lpp